MTHDPGREAWLQLSLAPGLGAATLRKLLGRFGLPERIVAAPRALLAQHLPAQTVEALHSDAVRGAVARALAWLEEPGNALVTLADASYPRLLLETADPPALLYCRGRLELLARPALAMVGSRNATPQGVRNARGFARSFSEAGLTIVSGLAQGIDSAAHRGALEGAGSTIAVFGTGMDVVYPRENRALAEQIGSQGLLLSELPLGSAALGHHFPRRNRVISGLALGCLVVEAALASGSLTTARAAADQGREVFAIPGSIHSPLSKGCHALIKSGAKLVESADDVLGELGSLHRADPSAAAQPAAVHPADTEQEPVLLHMGFDPVGVDSLCERARLPAARVAAELLRLELAGRVAALPGGLYQRLK
jgi:DNA processing protein